MISNLKVVSSSLPVPQSVLFWSLIKYHFLVANFEDFYIASPNKAKIFCFSIFIHGQNQTTVAAFCLNSKVVSPDFLMMKNFVAPSFLSTPPIKLICCFKLGFLIQFVCLNLFQLICNVLKSIHNPINSLSCNHCFFPF